MDGNRTRTNMILAVLLPGSLAANAHLTLQVPLFPTYGKGGAPEMPEDPTGQGAVVEGDSAGTGSSLEGIATLQGPVVIQRSEGTGNGPFTMVRTVTEGVMINLSVELRPGKGRVLVETEPLMGIVFQDTARTAVEVVEDMTGISLATSDVIFSVEADEEIPAVDGPSAGALMTSLVLSALNHQMPRQDVTLTGTIDASGHVGAIGGVVEKAQAAEESGKSLILLPRENARLVQYIQTTRTAGRTSFQQQMTKVIDTKEYIELEIGIQVEYVDTISDVMMYLGVPG